MFLNLFYKKRDLTELKKHADSHFFLIKQNWDKEIAHIPAALKMTYKQLNIPCATPELIEEIQNSRKKLYDNTYSAMRDHVYTKLTNTI